MELRLHVRSEGVTSGVEVEELRGGVYRLLENPLFLCDLTRGTVIRAEGQQDGTHEFIAVIELSDLVTRRFFLSPKYSESDYRVLGDELVKHGGFWQVDWGGFLTVNLPKDLPFDVDQVMADLGVPLSEVIDDRES